MRLKMLIFATNFPSSIEMYNVGFDLVLSDGWLYFMTNLMDKFLKSLMLLMPHGKLSSTIQKSESVKELLRC